MSKRILITSTDLMMIQFLVPHVIYLSQNGFAVELACSEVDGRLAGVHEILDRYTEKIHQVRLVRSPASASNINGYHDMKAIINSGHYDLIWTNEPVMGVVTRLAAREARKQGTKVVYMVHGFHFYNGAPILNWMVYYPVERFCSRFCDAIVTINHEDEERAKKMHAGAVKYIHGIGINTSRLHSSDSLTDIRTELNLPDDSLLVLSIGELSHRKNHKVIIEALGKLKDPRIHYLICGKGDLHDDLIAQAEKCGLKDQIHLLGYRKDVVDICSQADIFALPSLQEGLSVASLEAMYCGLPVVISDIRGVRDYIQDGVNGFICNVQSSDQFAESIKTLIENAHLRKQIGYSNVESVRPYCIEETRIEVMNLIECFSDMIHM